MRMLLIALQVCGQLHNCRRPTRLPRRTRLCQTQPLKLSEERAMERYCHIFVFCLVALISVTANAEPLRTREQASGASSFIFVQTNGMERRGERRDTRQDCRHKGGLRRQGQARLQTGRASHQSRRIKTSKFRAPVPTALDQSLRHQFPPWEVSGRRLGAGTSTT